MGSQTNVRRALLGTLPGRLLIVGGTVKLVSWLLRVAFGIEVPLLDAVGAVGSIAVVVALTYFLYKVIIRAKRRFLWRVRRKLILSYIFVGVVPVLLLLAFFLLSGFLLFLNVGSYLVASCTRRAIDDARLVAQETALELSRSGVRDASSVLERNRQALSGRYPGASLALVPTSAEPCAGAAAQAPPAGSAKRLADVPGGKPASVAVGPWSMLDAPAVLPSWVSCTGFGNLIAIHLPPAAAPGTTGDGSEPAEAALVIRGVGIPEMRPPTFAVVVDIPFDAALESRIRDETSLKIGHVRFTGAAEAPASEAGYARPVSQAARPAASGVQGLAVFETTVWQTGRTETVVVAFEARIKHVYDRLSEAGGRIAGSFNFGTLLLFGLTILAILFFIIEIVALIMGLVLARSITGSVHELFAGTEQVRKGEFGHKIRIRSRDQMGELAESFNSMTASIEDLLRQAEEKKRLEEELRIARVVQMSLLPRGPLSVPGLSITTVCVPAREVGGDYFDVLPLGDGRLGVLIADVSGKGTSAAFYMAELKGLMLSLSRIHTSPRKLLIEANRIIANNLDSRSFITMTYAVVDPAARTLVYARAGHTPLIHRVANGDGGPKVRVLVPDGLVVGLQMDDGGALFERLLVEEKIPLVEGDLFMFFTDGVSEAMNSESDCFGEARVSEILGEHGDLPPEELRERILREVEAFVGGAPQHDDMTMILLKVERVAAPVLAGSTPAAETARI